MPSVADSAPHAPSALHQHREQEVVVLKRRRLNQAIIRFLGGWVACLVILSGIALLSNLEWARPKVEAAMEESFHRRVELGRLGWTLGLNGLSIWTNKLSLIESDGKPFIRAGESEIGVAFLPLLHKRVIVKHVEFHHPEVFATQLAPGKWNFSDLLVEGPEIHYVEVDDGVLHLRNTITDAQVAKSNFRGTFANTNWRSYDFQSVAVKLVFPKKNQKRPWPFYLAFKLPREGDKGSYTTDVSLTALCSGPFEQWAQNPCEVELRADSVNPSDWRPFIQIPSTVDALIGFRFKGKGLIDDVLHGEFSGVAKQISLHNGDQTIFSAPQAKWKAKLAMGSGQVRWTDLNLEVAGVAMQSNGVVREWRSDNPNYSVVVAADLHNLSQLSDTSFWRLLPGVSHKNQPPPLSGAALVELQLQGDARSHTVSTSLKAKDVPLGHLLAGDDGKNAPFLSLFKVTPNAPIRGQILIDGDETITLKDVEIPTNGSKLRIDGMINARQRQHDVMLSSTDLVLDNFDTAQLESGKAPSILLSGKVDVHGHLFSDQQGDHIDIAAKLKKSVVSVGKEALANQLVGDIRFDGTSLKFHQLSGAIDNKNGSHGSIELNGYIETTGKKPACSLALSGKTVNIDALASFCRSAKLPLPEYAVANMSGLARDINIDIVGTAAAPALTLKLTPEDVYYQMRPASGRSLKPLKITGGTIVLTGDRLELKELPLTAQSGKLMLTATFVGTGNDLAPKMVHLKSGSIGIEEAQEYAQSPDIPEQTRKSLAAVVAPLQLTSVTGKTSGDLKVTMNNSRGDCSMEGTLGFANVSGKVFEQHMPFERLSGTAVVQPNQLQIQEVSFESGSSHFYLQGDVKNVDQSPLCNLQLSGQYRPEDILGALPNGIASQIEAGCNSPLTLKATISGDERSTRIGFSSQAHPGVGLRYKAAGWQLTQAPGEGVTVDGNLVMKTAGPANSLQIEDIHAFIGEATLQCSGKYDWFDDSRKPSNMELVLTTQTPVAARTFVGTMFGGTDLRGCTGTVKGTLAFAGTPDNLLTHGELIMSGLTVPAWNLKDIDGRLHSPRWSLAGATIESGTVSQMQVQVANATVGGVPLRQMTGTVVLDNGKEPRLSLTDGAATVAGGKLKVAGWYAMNSRRWHLDSNLDDLQVDEFVTDLIEHSGEVTGLARGHIVLEGRGLAWNEAVPSLEGSGEINVAKGTVPKMAQLQEKLTQANLLQQGIFGFNLNNVLQSVLPGKAGHFKEATLAFNINRGTMNIERLNFVGNDLRLRGAGSWNLSENALSVDIAGNIPRVASSILPGAVGEVSRKLTLQKAVRVMTFNTLENLPTVPILGDIGTDDPRAFTFKVACSLATPNAVQQSISRSFKWLPNKPNASAHPVPGLLPTISISL